MPLNAFVSMNCRKAKISLSWKTEDMKIFSKVYKDMCAQVFKFVARSRSYISWYLLNLTVKKVILLRLLQRLFLSLTYVTYSGLKPSIVEINEQNLKDPVHIPLNSVKRLLVLSGVERKKSSDFTEMASYLFFMDTSIAITAIQGLIAFSVFSYRISWPIYNIWRLQSSV